MPRLQPLPDELGKVAGPGFARVEDAVEHFRLPDAGNTGCVAAQPAGLQQMHRLAVGAAVQRGPGGPDALPGGKGVVAAPDARKHEPR